MDGVHVKKVEAPPLEYPAWPAPRHPMAPKPQRTRREGLEAENGTKIANLTVPGQSFHKPS